MTWAINTENKNILFVVYTNWQYIRSNFIKIFVCTIWHNAKELQTNNAHDKKQRCIATALISLQNINNKNYEATENYLINLNASKIFVNTLWTKYLCIVRVYIERSKFKWYGICQAPIFCSLFSNFVCSLYLH